MAFLDNLLEKNWLDDTTKDRCVEKVYAYILGHERMFIFNIRTFFNFQFRMFECLFTL